MSTQRIGKYACLEIERRFLLRAVPARLVEQTPECRITDRYFFNTRLRLRKMEYPDRVVRKLTQKFRDEGQDATETTITNLVLNEREFEMLRQLDGQELLKDRLIYEYQGRRFGVDVFRGELEGLILAEVEFEARKEAVAMAVPEFAAAEVTEDPRFTGGELAKLDSAGLKVLLAS